MAVWDTINYSCKLLQKSSRNRNLYRYSEYIIEYNINTITAIWYGEYIIV